MSLVFETALGSLPLPRCRTDPSTRTPVSREKDVGCGRTGGGAIRGDDEGQVAGGERGLRVPRSGDVCRRTKYKDNGSVVSLCFGS